MVTTTQNESKEALSQVVKKFTDLVVKRLELEKVGASTKEVQGKIEVAYLNLQASSQYKQGAFEIGEYNNSITQGNLASILSKIIEL